MIAVARTTVAEQLRESSYRELLEALPQGSPESVRRPDTPPSQWPLLSELQARVKT